TAADAPRKKMASVKIQPSSVSFQSSVSDLVIPSCRVSGKLNTLRAYAWPMQRWVARAQGGISQRLNPGLATIRSFSRKLSIGEAPFLGPARVRRGGAAALPRDAKKNILGIPW